MNVGEYEANMRSLAGDRPTKADHPSRQLTLTQCKAEGRLVPPPTRQREPWPMAKDLPPGVQAEGMLRLVGSFISPLTMRQEK